VAMIQSNGVPIRSQYAKYLPEKLRMRLRKTMFQVLKLHWVLPSGVIVQVRSFADWITYNEIFVRGEYEPAIHRALALASPGEPFYVVDLGANVGTFSLRCADVLLRKDGSSRPFWIDLVEGSQTTFRELVARLDQPALPPSCARPRHGLVGKRSGSARISNLDIHAINSVTQSTSSSVEVPYVDLNEFCNRKPVIDLLKCDIEGSEFDFLQAYADLLARTRVAVLELHHRLCDISACLALLEAVGMEHETLRPSDGETSIHLFWRSEMPAVELLDMARATPHA
jgi:FkbM family methyltransferase